MPSKRRLAVTTLGTFELLRCEDVLDDAVRGKARHLSEDEDRRALQPETLGARGKIGDGCGDAPLVLAARILDREHRERRGEAGLEQRLGDGASGGDAHIDEQRVLARGESSNIEM